MFIFNKRVIFETTMRVIALIAFFTLANTTMAARWFIYDCSVLPNDSSLGDNAWELMAGSEENLAIEEDSESILGGKVLHADTTHDVAAADFRMYHYPPDLSKMTFEARWKMVELVGNSQGWACYISFAEPKCKCSAIVLCEPDVIGFWAAAEGDPYHGNNYPVDMAGGYHILRVTKDGDRFKAYLDGEKKLLWEDRGISPDETAKPTITLGDGTGTSGADVYWDYIAYTAEGNFKPSEEPFPPKAVKSGGKLAITWAAIR